MSKSIDAQELKLAAIKVALKTLEKQNSEYPRNNLGAGRELAKSNVKAIGYILEELMGEDTKEDFDSDFGCHEEESE